MGFVKSVVFGIYNLLLGLVTVARHLGRKEITIQYPEERMEMFERSRGVVVLLSDPKTGKLNCTACLLCEKACPVAAIHIEREKDPETKKRYPTVFTIDNTICCFCGLCEEACNFTAIKLAPKYEFSCYDKDRLLYDMDYLQELGRDVKYEPRKKPERKPKPKPKPEAGAKAGASGQAEDKEKPAPPTAASKEPESPDKRESKPAPEHDAPPAGEES